MNESSGRDVCQVARQLGRRMAGAGALLVAFVSLLQHAPVWLACLRGAGTLLVLAVGSRLGTAALGRAIDCDRALAKARQEKKS